jgi:hypothetical protein
MVAVLGPVEALPCYIHTYISTSFVRLPTEDNEGMWYPQRHFSQAIMYNVRRAGDENQMFYWSLNLAFKFGTAFWDSYSEIGT